MSTTLDYVYRLKDQYSRKLATITKKQVAFTEQYKKSMGKVNATAVAHQRILKKNNQYYKNSKHTIDRVSKSLERMTMHQKSYAKIATDNIRKLNDNMRMHDKLNNKRASKGKGQQMGLGGVVGGAGAGMFLKSAFDTSVKFEGQLNAIIALNSTFDRDLMKSKALQWGATTQHSALAVATAMRSATQMGMKQKDVIAAMPGVMALAAAGQMDLNSAMMLSSAVLAQYTLKQSKSLNVANMLAVAANRSKNSVTGIGAALRNVGAQASQADLSVKQTLVGLMAMAETGIKDEAAGTYFTRMLVNLKVGGKKIKKAFGTFLQGTGKQMGDFVDMDSRQFTNFEGFMDILRESGKAKVGTFATAFGIQGMKAITALSKVGKEKLTEFRRQMEITDGKAMEMAVGLMQGLPGGLILFQSALETTKLVMMDSFVSPLSVMLRGMATFLAFLSGSAPWLLAFIGGSLGVLTVITSLGIVSWVTIGALTNLKIAFMLLTKETWRSTVATKAKVVWDKIGLVWTKISSTWSAIRTAQTKKEAIATAWGTGKKIVDIVATKALTVATKASIVGTKALTAAKWLLNASLSAGKMVAFTTILASVFTLSTSAAIGIKAMTAAQWLFNAAAYANPYVLVAMGIAAIGAQAGYAAYKTQHLAKEISDLNSMSNQQLAEEGRTSEVANRVRMLGMLRGMGVSNTSEATRESSIEATQNSSRNDKQTVVVQGDIVVSAGGGAKVDKSDISFNVGNNMNLGY